MGEGGGVEDLLGIGEAVAGSLEAIGKAEVGKAKAEASKYIASQEASAIIGRALAEAEAKSFKARMGSHSSVATTIVDETSQVMNSIDRPMIDLTFPLKNGGMVQLRLSILSLYHLITIASHTQMGRWRTRGVDVAATDRCLKMLVSPESQGKTIFDNPAPARPPVTVTPPSASSPFSGYDLVPTPYGPLPEGAVGGATVPEMASVVDALVENAFQSQQTGPGGTASIPAPP